MGMPNMGLTNSLGGPLPDCRPSSGPGSLPLLHTNPGSSGRPFASAGIGPPRPHQQQGMEMANLHGHFSPYGAFLPQRAQGADGNSGYPLQGVAGLDSGGGGCHGFGLPMPISPPPRVWPAS